MSRPRILAGTAKGMPLETPPRGTRPSPSRLREAVFDMLQFRARGTFLDLYAGSGAIGLEAASRGFPAVLVELDRTAAEVLRRNARRLRLPAEVMRGDALAEARRRNGTCEVVFAAPPYPLDLAAIFTELLAAAPARPGGLYLFQHPSGLDVTGIVRAHGGPRAEPGWAVTVRRYGSNAVTRIEVPQASPGPSEEDGGMLD